MGHLHWCAPRTRTRPQLRCSPSASAAYSLTVRTRCAPPAQTRAPFAVTSCTSRRLRRKPVRCRHAACSCSYCARARTCVMIALATTPRARGGARASQEESCARRRSRRRTRLIPSSRATAPRRPWDSRRCGLQHRLGLLRPRLPSRLYLAVAQDALGVPAVQPRVGVCEDREDRHLRQPRLNTHATSTAARFSNRT